MKILQIIFLSLFSLTLSASNYSFNEEELNQEFAELNKIEKEVIESNFDVTTIHNLSLNADINVLNAEPVAIAQTNELYMDWGSFAWGFCCCPIGFFVVAVNRDADNDMKASYWIGVAASIAVDVVTVIAYNFSVLL
jgi:hypothetical protein